MIPNMQFGEILCVSGLSTVENSTSILNMLIGMVGQLDKHMIVMKKSHLAQIQGHLVTLLPLDFSAVLLISLRECLNLLWNQLKKLSSAR